MFKVKCLRASPDDLPFGGWYLSSTKKFRPDRFGRVEMKTPTGLSNKTSTASSCAENQILEYIHACIYV